jgi:hypothetical protein
MMKKTIFITLLFVKIQLLGFSQCFISGFGSLGNLSKTTGNYQLDHWFNIQKTSIERVFGVTADLYIYNDYEAANAYATTSNRADGEIAFGINMLTEYMWRMDKGKAGVAAVLAHEYGHVLQIEYESDLDWKYRELHADYLAGYYLRTKSYVSYYELNNFAKVFYDLGDEAFWSEDHHGTSLERLRAFKAGYNCSCSDIEDAYDKGETYVLGNSTTFSNSDNNYGEPEYEYITTPCVHPLHPQGDVSPCTHPLHPGGDIYPCQHTCRNYYGYIVKCHPSGDIGPCSHRAHPNGDITLCYHKKHPNGDIKEVRKY